MSQIPVSCPVRINYGKKAWVAVVVGDAVKLAHTLFYEQNWMINLIHMT